MKLRQRGRRRWRGTGDDRLRELLEAITAALAAPAPCEAPPELAQALQWAHHGGEVVRLPAAGHQVCAVLGSEGTDPGVIWQHICAFAVSAVPAPPGGTALR